MSSSLDIHLDLRGPDAHTMYSSILRASPSRDWSADRTRALRSTTFIPRPMTRSSSMLYEYYPSELRARYSYKYPFSYQHPLIPLQGCMLA